MTTYKDPITIPGENQYMIYGATSEERIRIFYHTADRFPERQYVIPYTAYTTDLPGGLTIDELAYMFAQRPEPPTNILFEETFAALVAEKIKERHKH